MPNITIRELPPVILPIDAPDTFLEVSVLEAGVEVSRKIAADDLQSAFGLDATFVTVTANAVLPNERILTAGTNLSIVDGGAGSTITINVVGLVTTLSGLSDVDLTGQAQFDLLFNVDGTNWNDTAGALQWDNANNFLIMPTDPSIFMDEKAAAGADVAGRGQFWVRDDIPNVPMFTDDAGVDFVLNAAGGFVIDQHTYQFSTSTSMFDPGSGFFRLNNATPASVTQISISDLPTDGIDIGTNVLANIEIGHILRYVNPTDLSVFLTYTVTSIFDGGTFFIFGLSHQSGVAIPANNASVTVEVQPAPFIDMVTVVPANGSLITYDTATDSFVSTANRGTITQPGVGETQLGTSDSALILFSASRVQTAVDLYGTFTSLSNYLAFATITGEKAISTGSAGGPLNLMGGVGGDKVRVMKGSTLQFQEVAAAQADDAGFGQVWTRNDVPNTLMFTDDAGTDFVIGGALFSIPDPLLLGNGSLAAPTYSFTSDPNTGVFLVAADQLGLVAGGVRVANLTEVGGVVQMILPLSNTPATPTLAFGNGNSGFYEFSDNQLRVAIAGASTFILRASGFQTTSTGGPMMLTQAASATAPGFAFDDDLDTGIGSAAADQLSLIAGATELIRITEAVENKIDFNAPLFIGEQAAAFADVAGDGQIWVENLAANTLMFTDDSGIDFRVSCVQWFNNFGGQQQVNNSTTPVVITQLSGFQLDANSVYHIEIFLKVNQASVTPDITVRLNPQVAGTFSDEQFQVTSISATGVFTFQDTGVHTALGAVQDQTGNHALHIIGVVDVGIGDLWDVEFAQAIATVANTIVDDASWVKITKIGPGP